MPEQSTQSLSDHKPIYRRHFLFFLFDTILVNLARRTRQTLANRIGVIWLIVQRYHATLSI